MTCASRMALLAEAYAQAFRPVCSLCEDTPAEVACQTPEGDADLLCDWCLSQLQDPMVPGVHYRSLRPPVKAALGLGETELRWLWGDR